MGRTILPAWHAGVRYRSLLEARYAFFLDRLEVKFDYEAAGFKTLTCYRPDFMVFAALGTLWAEIKPAWGSDPDGEMRFRNFAHERPQPSRAALIAGPPCARPSLVIGGDIDAENPGNGPWEDDTYEWRPCPSGYHIDLAYPGKFGSKFAEDGCPPVPGNGGEERIAAAATAARNARFDTRDNPPAGTAA
jgi:hypothetical protein